MAPHPLFPANFAPGTATSTQSSTCSILFYDDTQVLQHSTLRVGA